MKNEPLRFGIIGTGAIAADFATALTHTTRCSLTAVSGSRPERARDFAQRFSVAHPTDSIDALLALPSVDAVYVAVPHTLHEECTIRALRAKKAVLCEKPMAITVESAERMVGVARECQSFLMEAYMYRCHPITTRLVEELQAGVIGSVRHIRACFGFAAPRQAQHRLFNADLAGGAILDIGGYPLSFARLVAGVAIGAPYAEPLTCHAWGTVGPTGVDELATARLDFESGITAEIAAAIRHDLGTSAVVYGEEGAIILPDPWLPSGERQGTRSQLFVDRHGEARRIVEVEAPPVYTVEAEYVADSLPRLEPAWPALDWADTLGNMRVLEQWRQAVHANQ